MKRLLFFAAVIFWVLNPMFANAQNNALDFDGSNDFVVNDYTEQLNDFTLECWVKGDAAPTTGFAHELMYGSQEFGFNWDHDQVAFRGAAQVLIGSTYYAASFGTLEGSVWYHLAATFTSGELKTYKNGVLMATTVASGIVNTSANSMTIGSYYNGDRPFAGEIDEVRLWNDVRTLAEIRVNMYQELAGSEDGLQVYYKFHESTGTTAADSQTSGTYPGTLTNMAGTEWTPSSAFFGPVKCLSFDGISEFVDIGAGPTALKSVEFWVYPTKSSEYYIALNASSYISSNNGVLSATGFTSPTIYVDGVEISTVVQSKWQHIAVTTESSINASDFDIGRLWGSGNFQGKIDEVRIWNIAKTTAQVRENMFKTLTGNETDLAAYYNFDNTDLTLADYSPNTNDGTLTYMQTTDWVSSSAFNTWLNTNSSTWTTDANWSQGSSPVSTDNVGIYTYSGGTNATLSGSPTVNHFLLGGSSSITLSSGATVNGNLFLESNIDLNGQNITLGSTATLVEGSGIITGASGAISTTRNLSGITSQNVANLGATITTASNMGSTVITRGVAFQTGNGNEGVKRYYEITPTTNNGLNATLVFNYYDSELNGLTESELILFRSVDAGSNWAEKGGTVNTTANTVTLNNIDAFSSWTSASSAFPIYNVYRVDGSLTTGNNDGTSWADAYQTLQAALSASAAGAQIWIAKGTYYPSVEVGGTGARYQAFQMIEGVSIYGGFAGTETDVNQRTNYGFGETNETILSGDIGTLGDNADNSYHVFNHPNDGSSLSSESILDGCTISDGNANGGGEFLGGGMLNKGLNPSSQYNPTLNNCTFYNNLANGGAGMRNEYSSPILTNCTFKNNSNPSVSTSNAGGGMCNISESSPTLTNCTFSGNYSGGFGGGMYSTHSSPTISNCTFSNNSSNWTGGGIFNFTDCNSIITNCVFTNNSGSFGGAFANRDGLPTLTNCTFSNNTSGATVYAQSGGPITLTNCILWGASSRETYISSGALITSSYSDIEGSGGSGGSWVGGHFGTDGGNNVDADPLFAFAGSDYRLCSTSPCADAGSNAANSETYDIRGVGFNRILNTTIDMGAYEFKSGTDPVNPGTTWTGTTNTNWNTAGNWANSSLPPTNYNVIIPDVTNDPVISSTATANCNNLTIESGATFAIQSDISGTGSLIIDGALTNSGTITMQRYFPGATLLNWHMVSAPVTGMDISESGFNPGSSDDFYAWLETSPGIWVNYKNTGTSPTFSEVNGNDNFQPAKGYLVAYNEANPTKTFTGTLNTGNQTFTLKNSGAKDWTYVTGWNLLGNPYSSSIDWNLVTRTQFQDNYAYVYDPNAGGGAGAFVNINGANASAYIAPNQGFFVIATTAANDQTFTFTNAIQAHGGSYMKNKTDEEKLVLRLSDEIYFDEIQIRLAPQSTYNREREDAIKIYSYNDVAPQLQSYSSDNIPLAVNSIPEAGTDNNIPIGIRSPKDGVYKISIVEVSDIISTNGIYLEDLLMNSWHKLSESGYTFTSPEGDISDRFIIHFGGVGIDEPVSTKEIIHLWTADHTIHLLNSNNLSGKVIVINMYGQQVLETPLDRDVDQQISLITPAGYYIVNIVTKNGVINKKVYLR